MSGSRNRVLGYAPVTGALIIVMVVVLVTNVEREPGRRLADNTEGIHLADGTFIPYENLGIDYMPYSEFFSFYIHTRDHPVEMVGRMIASYYAGTKDISDRAADTFASDMYNILQIDGRSLHADYGPHDTEYLRAALLHTNSWRAGSISSAQLLESVREIPVGHRVDAFETALWAHADDETEHAGHDGDHRWRYMAYEVFEEYPYGSPALYNASLHGINTTRHELTRENVEEMITTCSPGWPPSLHMYNLETAYSPGSCILREPSLGPSEIPYIDPCNPGKSYGLPYHGLGCADQVVCSPIASGYDADALVADLERHRECHSYRLDIKDKTMCDKLPTLFKGAFYLPFYYSSIEYIEKKFC